MSDSTDNPAPAKRGEAAWKAAKAKIAERNDTVRKEGKQRREAYQQEKAHRRHASDRREQLSLDKANEQRGK